MSNYIYKGFDFYELNSEFQLQNTTTINVGETQQMSLPILNNQGDGFRLETKTAYNETVEFKFNIILNSVSDNIYSYKNNKLVFVKELEIPTPVNNYNPATKLYVDTAIGSVVAPTSVILTGDITGSGVTGSAVSTTLNKTLNQISNNGNIDIANYKITNLANPTTDKDASNKYYIDNKTWLASKITDLTATILSFRLDQFLSPTNNVSFNSKKITDVQTPTEPNDCTNKNYVDTAIAGVSGVMPIGAIAMWSTQTPPTGWLECNGTEINRLSYPLLFAVIGTTFGSGNGSTTFNLPESRGLFPRGWNHSSTRSSPYKDVDASSRIAVNTGGLSGDNIGTLQSDDYKSHSHTYLQPGSSVTVNGVGTVNVSNIRSTTNTGNSPTSGGNETRPVNFSVMFIIKAF